MYLNHVLKSSIISTINQGINPTTQQIFKVS
jgi:hypothetical protein